MPLNVEEKLAREREFPFRMLEFARTAVLHGWTVQLSKLTSHDVPAWKMIFRDDNHCLHLVYHRTPEKKIAKYGLWRNRYGSRGNCTAEPEKIHVAKDGLAQWLRTHRETCQGGPHLAEMATHHRCHCGGGHATIKADQRIRDTATALHKIVMSSCDEAVLPEMLYGPISAIVQAVSDWQELDGIVPDDGLAGMPEPCQPIGCDNGYHVPGCTYAAADGGGPYEGASAASGDKPAVDAPPFPFLELTSDAARVFDISNREHVLKRLQAAAIAWSREVEVDLSWTVGVNLKAAVNDLLALQGSAASE